MESKNKVVPRAINQIVLGALMLICCALTTRSQEQPPQLLLRAAQCLEVKKFLPVLKSARLNLAYFLDEKSYPGDKAIYVVDYGSASRSIGLVFTLFLKERDGRQEFNIQNNASFVPSKKEASGVSFVNPPLGGTWTQEHLASAIKEIEKQPRFAISVKDLSSIDASVSCVAYIDSQHKATEK